MATIQEGPHHVSQKTKSTKPEHGFHPQDRKEWRCVCRSQRNEARSTWIPNQCADVAAGSTDTIHLAECYAILKLLMDIGQHRHKLLDNDIARDIWCVPHVPTEFVEIPGVIRLADRRFADRIGAIKKPGKYLARFLELLRGCRIPMVSEPCRSCCFRLAVGGHRLDDFHVNVRCWAAPRPSLWCGQGSVFASFSARPAPSALRPSLWLGKGPAQTRARDRQLRQTTLLPNVELKRR